MSSRSVSRVLELRALKAIHWYLDFAPEDLDTVELGAVGGQEVQCQALFFELLDQG
jgi:hypothetical protein